VTPDRYKPLLDRDFLKGQLDCEYRDWLAEQSSRKRPLGFLSASSAARRAMTTCASSAYAVTASRTLMISGKSMLFIIEHSNMKSCSTPALVPGLKAFV
jgi:hypothetical protein